MTRVGSVGLSGLEARPVEVVCEEIGSAGGGAAARVTVLGLPPAVARELGGRVSHAFAGGREAFGGEALGGKVRVGVLGSGTALVPEVLELPVALAVLAAHGKVPAKNLANVVAVGAITLAGEVRPVRGVLSAALMAREVGATLLVPMANIDEARVVEGLDVVGVAMLSDAVAWALEPAVQKADRPLADGGWWSPRPRGDLTDYPGAQAAKRAMVVAAAGGHGLLLEGAAGSGTTTLAGRLSSLLPEMTREEAIEVTRVFSVAGLTRYTGLMRERQYRAPHSTISGGGMLGGTSGGLFARPGEVSLAHHGVLALDDLPNFGRDVLREVFRAVERGRAAGSLGGDIFIDFPAKVLMVGTMRPCPCGEAGGSCRCAPEERRAWRARVAEVAGEALTIGAEMKVVRGEQSGGDGLTTAQARELVAAAREQAVARQGGLNARLDPADIRRFCGLASDAERESRRDGGLARPTLLVARTVADLRGAERIEVVDIVEARSLRAPVLGLAVDLAEKRTGLPGRAAGRSR